MRIALIGHSGAGKSTTVAILIDGLASRGLRSEIVKLATPLYELQQQFRSAAGVELPPDVQDQVLLEDIAVQLRRLSARALADGFLRRVNASDADVIINDDLRDPDVDAAALRDNGFRIVRVQAPEEVRLRRLKARGDISTSDASSQGIHRIPVDATITNSGSVDDLRSQIRDLLEVLL